MPLSDDSTPPIELAVVGENKEDPEQLLLLGADGHYYAYTLHDGRTHAVEPDNSWDVDTELTEELFT